jgi:RNA polymerase sigma-70 factor (ECF subfamily)
LTGTPQMGVEFAAAAEPHRRELLVHCYQMLGSVHEAEDLVQETMERAWRAYDRYDSGRASMRTWLYRIATNACLNALQGRARRPLPSGVGQPFEDPDASFVPGVDVPWMQPFPDRLFGGPPEDPEMLAIERNRLRLALVAAMQLLSAKQRAALILRDVLAFSAAETADMLDISVAAANSALQRARGALHDPAVDLDLLSAPDVRRGAVLERYVAAFECADVDALTRLLADEVVLEMPPMWNWYIGRIAYGRFMHRVFATRGTRWRTLRTSANGQPAMAAYAHDGRAYALHTLQVFTTVGGVITRTTVFQEPDVFDLFALPLTLD